MPFEPETVVDVPPKDILSWYFDSPNFDQDQPIYIDATDTSRYWTANQCRIAIRKLAAGFRALGLKTGDCVCVYSFNNLDYPVLVNGIIGSGGVFTGCNPSYTSFELVHHLKSTDATFLIVEPELLEKCLKAAAEVDIPPERILLFADEGSTSHGLRSWRWLFEHGEIDWPRIYDVQTAKNTTAALMTTSGTTGLPKAAMISHHNLIAQYTLFLGWNTPGWQERRLIPFPMFHMAVAPPCHFSPLFSGAQIFVMRRFELESFLKNIEKHQITDVSFPAPVVHLILASSLSQRYSLKSLRQAHSGGAPLDVGSQTRLLKLMADNAPFTQIWGMTETTRTCASVPYSYGHEMTGAVGELQPNMFAKICDEQGNDISADDVRGELCVKGPLICQGYFRNPEANARDWDEDGYFHTGDIAYRSSTNKFWYIVDRKKELIKVRTFQVSPSEIEAALFTHESIIDAGVVGVPSLKAADGEEPRAYVTLRPGSKTTATDIHKHLSSRLARYKSCTGGIIFTDDIPKNPSGKKSRSILRERAKKELASERPQSKI